MGHLLLRGESKLFGALVGMLKVILREKPQEKTQISMLKVILREKNTGKTQLMTKKLREQSSSGSVLFAKEATKVHNHGLKFSGFILNSEF